MSKKLCIEDIYQDNRHWVYGSFLKKVDSIETAEDLSQTLWLNFFQKFENINFQNDNVIRAYLRSMVLHSLADYYRNLNKTDNLMRELELILGENITKDDFVHSEAFPDDSMDIVMAFYKELTEDEQLLISLKYKYRYTSKEIAEIIGISPSLVRMRLSRIIEKIRKHVNDNLE